ncbi:NAD(P)/FAD-dependent oxidoreductase [Streptomyces paludis]|uniref:FAD-binding oxidoreductase n=1 Tax=Streptomyces paludis TaxID=2282738 RepID=A0A345HRB6_9ACTN|nr:FAD-binding oxidoreductase [Streptomyces paludis]AXG79240.1 FAD-binding oxidoreductase [Streptomyces paludis]
MPHPQHADVLVVGAGIIGATTALALADHGRTVLCVGEPAAVLGTASSAAGAMLGVLGEVTADQDTVTDSLDEAELHLRHDSSAAWPALTERIAELTGAQPQIHRGTAVIATTAKASDRTNLAAIRSAAERLDLPCHSIAPADVPYLAPAPGHETTDALWLPHEGHVDTSTLLPAVHRALAAHPRIHLLTSRVREISHNGRHTTGAQLSDGTRVRSEHIVLAAGVATQELLDGLGPITGVVPRLLPGKGTSLVFREPGHPLENIVIRTPNRDFACGTHLIGRADGHLYLGATNRIADTPGATDLPTGGELLGLLDGAVHEINTALRTSAVTESRHGMRPLATDGRPLIGATALPGLYLATGTYRNGILLAPAIAELLTQAITAPNKTADTPFVPTAPWRNTAPDIPAVLRAGVPHIVSFLLEPRGHLPYNRQRELEAALFSLFRLAFTTGDSALRERCTTLLASAHVAEVVPQVYYELAAAIAPR